MAPRLLIPTITTEKRTKTNPEPLIPSLSAYRGTKVAKPENPITAVDTVPVWAEAGVLSHSVALRITRLASTDCLLIAEPAASGRAQGSAGGTSTWRVGELETDARMLFCRLTTDHHVTRVALVDGSIVRSSLRRHLELALPAVVPDLHLDMKGIRASQPFEYALARIAGPAFGAKLIVGGVERPIAGERRARVRT